MRHLLVGLVLLGACGGGSEGPGPGGGGGRTGRIRLVPNVVAGASTSAVASALAQAGIRVGSPAATNLRSLKYYVTSIQLCQDVEVMGSGYSRAEGCLEIYRNMDPGSPDYASYTVNEAKDDTTAGRYVDLMSAAGQAALRKPVTLEVEVAETPDGGDGMTGDAGATAPDGPDRRVGVYRYGLINFYRPIKVTAEFPIVGQTGQYFRTKAVTRVNARNSGGGFNSQQVEIGDTLSGATEETTYMLDNGGNLFTFQKPFVITQADIDAQAEIKIDLVFNPDNFGQAHEISDCRADMSSYICDPANNVVINMPFVRMHPVPRKGGERTRKETYLMDYDEAAKLRLELYYNDGDPEAGVQGVDAALVYLPTATGPTINTISSSYVNQTGSVRSNDATLSLQDYRRMTNLSGLRRRQGGTATVTCLQPGALCPSVGGTVTRPYSYVGDTVVSSD
jgi:hypothetical protein